MLPTKLDNTVLKEDLRRLQLLH